MTLTLHISDPDTVAEIGKHCDASSQEKYALSALRLGVLALRQASGELDATTVRDAATEMMRGLESLLTQRGAQMTGELSSALRQYFDPATGAFPQRVESLLRNDGELDRALRTHLAPHNSTIAEALAVHLGEGSSIFKLLSPTEAGGVKAQITNAVGAVLNQQREEFLRELSLDNKESALSRLVAELALNNGELTQDLQAKVSSLANNLTLDNEASALARMKRELIATIESQVTSNSAFQAEVRTTLATLQARKQEAARSTRHGNAFEDEAGLLISAEAQQLNDIFEPVGTKKGTQGHAKTGDFVTTLGPESVAAGARIVWEAKQNQSCTLQRARVEMDSARKNREAQIGIFVFSKNAAPEGLQPFARYGRDIFIVWDAEDAGSDIYIRAAYSVARALVVRESEDAHTNGEVPAAIEGAARAIEKQIVQLDQMKIWADTVKNNGSKMVDGVVKMREELLLQVVSLDRQVAGLKTELAQAA